MTIAPLQKLTVFGPDHQEQAALEKLQDLGCMHLVPLAPAPDKPEETKDRIAKDAYQALRFLNDVAQPRRQVLRDPAFDIHAFVPQVLDLRDRTREAVDRRDFLAQRIKDVLPWGDLIFPPKHALAGYHLWFYKLPVKDRDCLDSLDMPWQIVHEDQRFAYVVLISEHEPPSDILPVARIHTGAVPVSELKEQLDDAELALEDLAAERQGLTRYLTLMRDHLSQAETRAELDFGRQQVLHSDGIFAVQGWVPEDRHDAVQEVAEQMQLALLIEPARFDELPPTLLDQPDKRDAGVDLAMFYQVPNYRDWDPTIIVSASFAVFFAMIVADAGYGVVIGGLVAALWGRLGDTPHLRSWRRMLVIVAASTVIYGVMIGSYMGYEPPEASFLSRLKILNLNDFNAMMTLSVVIGVGHLILANVLAARVRWGQSRAYASLGWCAVLLGGLGFFLGADGIWARLSIVPFGAGLLAILVFSSDRPLNTPMDWLWRTIDGLQGLAGAMGAFGDVLSYMRLFALGLASASLAVTFNDLAAQIRTSIPGLGLFLAVLLFLIGHAMNFALAMMSGVVHGLRLNYIEFFKWGLSEEGIAFRPFARKEVQE